MYIFIGTRDPGRIAPPFLKDGFERRDNRGVIVVGKNSGGTKRIGPRDASRDIVLKECAIESERDAEVECSGIRSRIEATRPKRHAFTSRA